MFSFLWKQTYVDPTFGALTGRGGKWKGTIQCHLFPQFVVTVWILAADEHEWTEHRGHFQQVESHADIIRKQIEAEAFETFKVYEGEEGDRFDYPQIQSPGAMWSLLKPIEWTFVRTNKNFKSRVLLECSWPNPHDLVAYLDDSELYHLNVEG
jgi:hypothetical protein